MHQTPKEPIAQPQTCQPEGTLDDKVVRLVPGRRPDPDRLPKQPDNDDGGGDDDDPKPTAA